MRVLKRVWEELTENIVNNFWIHTKANPIFDAVGSASLYEREIGTSERNNEK